MSEQVLDLRGTLNLLRRQRRTVAVFAVIGALVGAGVTLARPPRYQATALVLVPSASSPSGSSPIGSLAPNSNVTDSEIASSSAVLARAGAEMTPSLPPAQVRRRVTAAPVQTNLVQITASGDSARQAEALADAVANQLVTFVTSSGASQEPNVLSGLQAEASQLTAQLSALNTQIKATQQQILTDRSSAQASQATALLGSLTTDQSNAALQLQSVNSQIASTKLDMATANSGTEVLQYADQATPPLIIGRIAVVLVGALVGLVIGAAVVILRRHQKLVSRDEVAEAVGVPVVLSLAVGRWSRTSNWLRLLKTRKPSDSEVWDINKALSRLDFLDGPPILTVITLAGDTSSVAAAVRIALATAAMNVNTALVVTSDDASSIGLGTACDRLSARNEAPRPNLRLSKGSGDVTDPNTDLTIISIVIDPDQPKLPAFVARGIVVLAYSAGFADRDQLTRVLMAARAGGVMIKGVVVTNPSPGDRTSGAFPELKDHAGRILRRRVFDPTFPATVGRSEVR